MARVVITGRGTINSLGRNVKETNLAMVLGKSGINKLQLTDSSGLNINIAAQVKGFEAEDFFSKNELNFLDPFSQFALISAKEALTESELVFTDELNENTGVIIGTAGGGINTQEDNYRLVFQENRNKVHPFIVPKMMHNAAASNVAKAYGFKGSTYSISSACASSNHAISNAFQLIRSGGAKVMIAGGSDSMLTFGGIKAWEGLRVMSKSGCRPFCLTRDGLVQGEGSAVFVLEDFDFAAARGANILAEIIGCSMTSDGNDLLSPSLEGVHRAIVRSLEDAHISSDLVDYINAHGTGTKINDYIEASAISLVFSESMDAPLVSATKSMHGHVMGASGAIELLSCIYALNHNVVVPTIGFLKNDPSIKINLIQNESREARIDIAMSNAFAFGGLNSVLVLKSV
jgi:nodulation protein E